MKENNWLGTGKAVEFQVDVDEESLAGVLSLTDPNYDNLGNSLNYFLKVKVTINQIKVMKIQLFLLARNIF